MKEDSVKCPTCLVPLEFTHFIRDTTRTQAVYKCPKCGWFPIGGLY